MTTQLIAQLSPALRRALLNIEARTPGVRVRSDVLQRLRQHRMIEAVPVAGWATLTGDGRAAAAEVRAALEERTDDGPVDVDVVLLAVPSLPATPPGATSAVVRMLADVPSDAERVAILTWLAGPDGAQLLGAVKDAVIVACRPGRTYRQTAAHLGVSHRAVNKAVTRSRHRQSELDNPPSREDDLTGKAVTPGSPTEG